MASSQRAVTPTIEVYKAASQTAALYGAEIWGSGNVGDLTRAENDFVRALLSLPHYTPLTPLFYDLDLKRIGDLAAL